MLLLSAGAAWATTAAADSRAERLPGGRLSVPIEQIRGLLATAPVLHPETEAAVLLGRSFFRSPWVQAPASTSARDGLGPLFNARACATCHPDGGRGAAPSGSGEAAPALILKLSLAPPYGGHDAIPAPGYGSELQRYAVHPTAGAGTRPMALGAYPGEGRLVVRYREHRGRYGDGTEYHLRVPEYRIEAPVFGPLPAALRTSARLAPALLGLGLLEAIPEDAIVARADPDDRDGDGISGRANRVQDRRTGKLRLGRFGHKATQPNLEQQVAAAFRDDLGVTSVLYPEESCTTKQEACLAAASGADPREGVELTQHLLTAVTTLVRVQGVPERRALQDPEARRGEATFHRFGCAGCHVPQHLTDEDAAFPELANQTIAPYTDLLLHDLGPALADQHPEGEAAGSEWRTAPLWGLSAETRAIAARGYLHDGRARDLAEAILWHGGEAETAREAFRLAPALRRQSLLRFLGSL